jgi:predicted ATPase/DNA-binding SARP family transcriptional activator
MPIEIRLLGRFDVVHQGTAQALGGPRQRAVLAVLTIHANEIVSTDRLAEEVWGGEPPATAVVTMQRYISHLRRALDGLPVAIETNRPGYVLRVDPDHIDARRFERLVDEGRRHLTSGHTEEAAATLSEALDLWQGDPLADFTYEPFARIETTRLEELRSTAVELRIDADLELGRHRDLVPELEALVAAHPLRESYRGQLMRALHGSGRRADALRVYTEGRHVLAEELGLDPSTTLQRLEQAILLKDPDVEGPQPAPRPPTRLPAELTTFVGRTEEVDEVSALMGTSRLVTLTGVGGSGKSRLALRVATVLTKDTAQPAWLCALGDVADPEIVPRAVAQAVGIREEPGRPALDTLVDALHQQPALLVLDGCEHLLDAVAPLVQHVLAHTAEVRFLVTSREILDVPGESVFRVPTLTEADSARLFIERATAADAGFKATDDDAADIAEICQRLDCLPLALELAAARIDVLTLRQLADRLDDRFSLLTGGRRTAPARHRTLRATIAWSYDLLTTGERLLFERLSVFAGSFNAEAADAVCGGDGLDPAEVFDLLARLVRKSLVVRVPTQGPTARYRLLDTLRDFGRERLHERGALGAVRKRHAQVFADLMQRAGTSLQGPGAVHVLDDLEVEHGEFRAALGWLLDTGDAEGACRLAASLAPFWDHRYHVRDARMWLGRALTASRSAGSPPSRAQVWANVELAFVMMELDDFDATRAHLDEATRLLQSVRDDVAEAKALRVGAEVARFGNDLERALELSARAVALSHGCGDTWGEADAYRLLTLTGFDRGDFVQAASTADVCLRLFQACGDVEMTAGAQLLVGSSARIQGRLAHATALFEDSLGRFQQAGEPIGLAASLWLVADMLTAQGECDAAVQHAEEARRVLVEIEYARGIGQSTRALAEAELGRGRLDEAKRLCQDAVQRFRDRGYAGDLLLALGLAARIELRLGDADAALATCDEALLHARQRGFGRDIGWLLCLRAEIRLAEGEAKEAAALAEEAVELFQHAQDVPGRALAFITLAEVAVADGRPADGRRHLDGADEVLHAAGASLTIGQRRRAERVRAAL